MTEWLKKLNKEQREAVVHVDGPLFVVAGAGTGKTRTLTTRVAYLIKEVGINPNSILAVTFTNKAAKEMKERIVDMAGPIAYQTWIYTFHAFGVQVLRRDIEKLEMGYQTNFNIADEEDAKLIIRGIIKRMDLDRKEYKVNIIRNKISNFKYFNEDRFNDDNEKKVYQRYQKELIENNLLDFDDLQILLLKVLKKDENVRKYYQDKFKYILVDEFQDTDLVQYNIIKLLANKDKNVFVVGDPDQSIYGFRGADYENALRFKSDFGNEHILNLNYRSTTKILEHANRLIKNNLNRPFEKDLTSELGQGIEPFFWRAQNDFGEANLVANEINRLVQSGKYKYSDISIMYRNNALSRTFEDTLMKFNIPYVMYGGISFYQRKEIKDILAYIRVIIDPNLDFYLKRIINIPRRAIGNVTIGKLEEFSRERDISIFQAIDYLEVSGKTKHALLDFKKTVLELQHKLLQMEDLNEVVPFVNYQTGYEQMLKDDKDDVSDDRLDNIKELRSVFVQGSFFYQGTFLEKLTHVLDQIALYTDLDKADSDDAVVMSTFHQVKGLEFKVVFMTVMEDEIFPSPHSNYIPDELEEERRVAYVGVTRAKERLYLTSSEQRMLYGNFINPTPSLFIHEMKPESSMLIKEKPKVTVQDDSFLKPGDTIVHSMFGEGMVVAVEDEIATIAFKMPHGIKKLMESHPSIKKKR